MGAFLGCIAIVLVFGFIAGHFETEYIQPALKDLKRIADALENK